MTLSLEGIMVGSVEWQCCNKYSHFEETPTRQQHSHQESHLRHSTNQPTTTSSSLELSSILSLSVHK